MRAAIGYERQNVPLSIGEANMARAFRRGLIEKPVLVVSFDPRGWIGKYCTLPGDEWMEGEWQVRSALRDQSFARYYLVEWKRDRNVRRIVCDCDMTVQYLY